MKNYRGKIIENLKRWQNMPKKRALFCSTKNEKDIYGDTPERLQRFV
ncbi:MAG: hypothetical protein L6V93_14475 [Clostridiales bacterium]|nr:MAG: hypothetical protein L6V93_14475 [Clostridiales bacterium]